ncbi:MAG: DUF928 domain-containing protein [Cyanobacteria bacterium P01_C01_bin.121]
MQLRLYPTQCMYIMGCFYTTKSTLILAVVSVFTLSALSAAAQAENFDSELRQGLPGRRISSGSRSSNTVCFLPQNEPVFALMPKSNVEASLAPHEPLYQKSLALIGETGLMQLSLPDTVSPLRASRDDRWYFSVVCNQANLAADLAVTGWVRPVESDSALHSLSQKGVYRKSARAVGSL